MREAQYNLGLMYADRSKASQQNYAEAVKWYRKAAEQGVALTQFNLGVMYLQGRGVKQDYREAVGWYRKAAEQGYADAQFSLGLMYAGGLGVALDYVQAHKWFNIASALGYKDTKKIRQRVEKNMSAQQIGQAQTEATKWLEDYKKRRP